MNRLGRSGVFLARIRQKLREGALPRLAEPPGARKKTVFGEQHERLMQELAKKVWVLAEMALEWPS